ncbi:MAG: hypothetical protein WBX02_07390 [Terriglobales bacterium]
MNRFVRVSLALAWSASLLAWGQGAPRNNMDFPSNSAGQLTKVPEGVVLVKGARPSASDSVTPVPEGGNITNNILTNKYFGMTYSLPPDWRQKYEGPPPSDSGRYVLAQITPADTFKGPARANILVTAQDLFFSPPPTANAVELINFEKDNLQADYKVELPPTQMKIVDRSFTFFAYWSPVAELHWYVLATEMRCHVLQIVLSSRDTKLLENLMRDLNKMRLPPQANATAEAGGSAVPVCIKDYVRDENMIAKVNPVFTEHRFNPVPVRIIIDKEGKIKHIHFLSAFPDQAKAITEALGQWKFKRYLRDGQPVEVETGIIFGRASQQPGHLAENAVTQ